MQITLEPVVNGLYERTTPNKTTKPSWYHVSIVPADMVLSWQTRILVLAVSKEMEDGQRYITKYLDEDGKVQYHEKWEYGWRLDSSEWKRVA